MPIPYNKDFTRRKSSYLHDLDCRTTGATKTAIGDGPPYFALYTSDEIIEAGECISMVRVPKNFVVTDVLLTFSNIGQDASVGVGDPFCCGRFLGPILANKPSGWEVIGSPQGTFGCTQTVRLSKVGRGGDGCGFGYKYTCITDIIITNGYGTNTFQQGGGSVSGTSMGGGYAGPIPSGVTFGLKVDGFVDPS